MKPSLTVKRAHATKHGDRRSTLACPALRRTLQVAAVASFALFGLTAHSPAQAYAPKETFIGTVDGHPAWKYGGYMSYAECQRDADIERAAWRNPAIPYPTARFGRCDRGTGDWYFLQAVRAIA